MRRHEQGFALLIVVALLALMAALIVDFMALAQTDMRATRNEIELARARSLAEAGYALALNDLVNPRAGKMPPADGRSRDVALDGGRIALAVADEGGKIDLNWAPIELISGLLDGLDMPGDVEARILGAVTERRGKIALPQYAPGDIAASALLGGPSLERLAHMPFASISQLEALTRMDQALFARVAPALTVYSESRRINMAAASRAVLLAIPGITPAMADAIVAARQEGGAASAPVQLPDVGAYAAAGGMRAATITADAVTATGVHFRRRAVVAFTGAPAAPVRVLEWRGGEE